MSVRFFSVSGGSVFNLVGFQSIRVSIRFSFRRSVFIVSVFTVFGSRAGLHYYDLRVHPHGLRILNSRGIHPLD